LNLSACDPSSSRQVKNLKALFPEVKQFADDNSEFMQTLLDIRERVREFNELMAELGAGYSQHSLPVEFLPILMYTINAEDNQVQFIPLLRTLSPEDAPPLITEDERALISDSLLKMSYEYRSIRITPEDITIPYANSGSTVLCLVNPAVEVSDPEYYPSTGPVVFTEPVNDNWCIKVSRFARVLY